MCLRSSQPYSSERHICRGKEVTVCRKVSLCEVCKIALQPEMAVKLPSPSSLGEKWEDSGLDPAVLLCHRPPPQVLRLHHTRGLSPSSSCATPQFHHLHQLLSFPHQNLPVPGPSIRE